MANQATASDFQFYDIFVPQNVRLSKIYEKSLTESEQHQLATILLLFSNRFSLSTQATACGIVSLLLIIKTSNWDLFSVFLCSLNISNLFTDVPQAETTQICADAFYSLEHPPVPFLQQIFSGLMKMATSSVEFGFDEVMHRQVDLVALDHPFDYLLPIFCWLL